MKTAKIKQAVLNKLDNMTDDELIEVYLNSLKSQGFASNETIANLLARVSQLELQVQILQGGRYNSQPWIAPTIYGYPTGYMPRQGFDFVHTTCSTNATEDKK